MTGVCSYTDVEKVIVAHEIEQRVKFVRVHSTAKLKEPIDTKVLAKRRIVWIDGVCAISYCSIALKCLHGPDYHKKSKKTYEEKISEISEYPLSDKRRYYIQDTRKLNCPAECTVQRKIIFPDFKDPSVTGTVFNSKSALKTAKAGVIRDLQRRLETAKYYETFILTFSEHENHPTGQENVGYQPLDDRMLSKIKDLVIQLGVTKIKHIRRHLMVYARDLGELDETNQRFYPTRQTVKNAVMKLLKTTNDHGCSNDNSFSEDDQKYTVTDDDQKYTVTDPQKWRASLLETLEKLKTIVSMSSDSAILEQASTYLNAAENCLIAGITLPEMQDSRKKTQVIDSTEHLTVPKRKKSKNSGRDEVRSDRNIETLNPTTANHPHNETVITNKERGKSIISLMKNRKRHQEVSSHPLSKLPKNAVAQSSLFVNPDIRQRNYKLTSVDMAMVKRIIDRTWPNINTQDFVYRQREEGFEKSGGLYAQLIDTDEHWISVTNIRTEDDVHVRVFDSLGQFNNERAMALIASLERTTDKQLNIKFEPIQYQRNVYDSGIHAVANLVELLHGNDPSKVVYDVTLMRKHLYECLKKDVLKIFPTTEKKCRKIQEQRKEILVYCECRLPDDGSRMIQCQECQEWYHSKCIRKESYMLYRDNDTELYYLRCRYCHPPSSVSGNAINHDGVDDP